jgi:hypothetical protein
MALWIVQRLESSTDAPLPMYGARRHTGYGGVTIRTAATLLGR